MNKSDFNKIQKIEMSATKKLLTYISEEIDIENVLKEVNFKYPYFQDENNKLAFNVWLSIDYIGRDGKTFIEKFLEDKSNSLTPLEREILIEKNNSHISLLEIVEYEKEYIIVKDILQDKILRLREPDLHEVIEEGEFILTRVGKVIDNLCIIGDINYLPSSVKSMFMEDLLMDFNLIRKDHPNLIIKDYLKKYAMNLYKIYNDCILNAIEIDEDMNNYLYDELDEFEGYLQNKTNSLGIKKHISNLIDFFEYYLADEDLTLYDLNDFDFRYFFKEAIKDGFINSPDELNSYIDTFKKYILFLNNKTSHYREAHLELLDISENRFQYMNQLRNSNFPFIIDRVISSEIGMSLNEKAISFIMDYDKFILYTVDKPLELTSKNKYIKRKHLLELNSILDDENFIPESKSPNQEDFPMIHFFYKISLHLGLLDINGSYLTLNKKGTNYLRLKDEEKFTLFFQYIWSKEFVRDVIGNENLLYFEKTKKNFASLIGSLTENKSYGISSILPTFGENPDFFFMYYRYLEYLGLISCNLYPNYEFKISNLGRTLFKYLIDRENKKYECSVIQLDSYRK